MDIQLDELIGKIKKDGIEAARAEAEQIKADAKAAADKIVAEAKAEADTIVARAKDNAARDQQAGIAAIEQASRNLILSFKNEIQGILDNLTNKAVASSLSSDILKQILPTMLAGWAQKESDSLVVLLSEDDLKTLGESFCNSLASTLKGGVEIKATKKTEKGFYITEKDGSAFYDFSAASVAAMLSAYLNPRLAEILKGSEVG
jgi:V/A-type H+-transporting ATPase subunit E